MLGDETGAGELKGTRSRGATRADGRVAPELPASHELVAQGRSEISSATEADKFFAWLLAKSFREKEKRKENLTKNANTNCSRP